MSKLVCDGSVLENIKSSILLQANEEILYKN